MLFVIILYAYLAVKLIRIEFGILQDMFEFHENNCLSANLASDRVKVHIYNNYHFSRLIQQTYQMFLLFADTCNK